MLMQMEGLTITRPNWGRYHVFSTSYPPVGPAGPAGPDPMKKKGTLRLPPGKTKNLHKPLAHSFALTKGPLCSRPTKRRRRRTVPLVKKERHSCPPLTQLKKTGPWENVACMTSAPCLSILCNPRFL